MDCMTQEGNIEPSRTRKPFSSTKVSPSLEKARKMGWGWKDVIPTLAFPLCLKSTRVSCIWHTSSLRGWKWGVRGIFHCLDKTIFFFYLLSFQLVLLEASTASAQLHSFVPGTQNPIIKQNSQRMAAMQGNTFQKCPCRVGQETVRSWTYLSHGIVKPHFWKELRKLAKRRFSSAVQATFVRRA